MPVEPRKETLSKGPSQLQKLQVGRSRLSACTPDPCYRHLKAGISRQYQGVLASKAAPTPAAVADPGAEPRAAPPRRTPAGQPLVPLPTMAMSVCCSCPNRPGVRDGPSAPSGRAAPQAKSGRQRPHPQRACTAARPASARPRQRACAYQGCDLRGSGVACARHARLT